MTTKTLTPITVLGMIDGLIAGLGTQFLTLRFRGESKSFRKNATDGTADVNHHYGHIVHLWDINVMIGNDLEKSANKWREKHGLEPVEIGPAVNGMKRTDDGLFSVTKDGDINLALFTNHCKTTSHYIDARTGQTIDPEYLKRFKGPAKPYPFFTIRLSRIYELHIGGMAYSVDTSSYDEAKTQFLKRLPPESAAAQNIAPELLNLLTDNPNPAAHTATRLAYPANTTPVEK